MVLLGKFCVAADLKKISNMLDCLHVDVVECAKSAFSTTDIEQDLARLLGDDERLLTEHVRVEVCLKASFGVSSSHQYWLLCRCRAKSLWAASQRWYRVATCSRTLILLAVTPLSIVLWMRLHSLTMQPSVL